MGFREIIYVINRMKGNLVKDSDIYLSPQNAEMLLAFLTQSESIEGIHFHPFLIGYGITHELPRYMFELEVSEASYSYYLCHHSDAALPREIVEGIRPKAVVHKQDKRFYTSALQEYLRNMNRMTFDQELSRAPELAQAGLYYRVG